MLKLSPREREIRDLILEARGLLDSPVFDADHIAQLIFKLGDSAQRAAKAGLHFSERQMDWQADSLQARLDLRS